MNEQQALRELVLAAIEYQKVIRETIDDESWDESGKIRMVARWRLQKAALELPEEGSDGSEAHGEPGARR